jgi:hypothetical protein
MFVLFSQPNLVTLLEWKFFKKGKQHEGTIALLNVSINCFW